MQECGCSPSGTAVRTLSCLLSSCGSLVSLSSPLKTQQKVNCFFSGLGETLIVVIFFKTLLNLKF